MTTYRYGCGALVDTSAPVEVVPADARWPPFRAEHIYRCTGCGADVQRLDGMPMTGEVRHGEPVPDEESRG
jgi:hypothetical protein